MKRILLVLMFMLTLTACTKTFDDGSVYEGKLDILFRPHEYGVLNMANGDVYEGEFEHGAITGQGFVDFHNGHHYEGEFLEGKLTGTGVYTYSFGDVHTGEFLDGVLDGEGKIEFFSGYIKEGTFIEGQLETGYATTMIEDEELTIDVVNGEYITPDNFVILSSQHDLVEALASAMQTGEKVYVNTQDFGSILYEMAHPDYGYAPMFDNASNIVINEFDSYNPTFSSPIVFSSENIPYLSTIQLRFELDQTQLDEVDQEVTRVVNKLIQSDMSDYAKVKTLHDYVAEKVTYYDDYETATNDIHHTAYGALINGSAVCDGYMDAFHLLLNEAGIESYNITGDDLDNTDNYWHAWNLVKIEEDYYHIDVTWNDSDNNKTTYDYFGKTDKEISEDHVIFSFNKVPKANGEKYDYYPMVAKNRTSTYIYYSNATYYGQINTSKEEHGYGKLWWTDGSKYFGNFNNGEKTSGTQYYANGDRFEGDFNTSGPTQGTLYFTNGDRFTGDFTNDGQLGYGTYTWSDGYSETRNFND